MALMISDDKKNFYVTCKCGCEGILFKVDDSDKDYGCYALCMCYSNNYYKDQDDTVLKVIKRKFKKIWAILRNKDYYYSELIMTKEDFDKFKEHINQF